MRDELLNIFQESGDKHYIELTNARFTDIRNNCYYRSGTSLIIHKGRIDRIIDRNETNSKMADITVDLGGKTVIPGLFNTHCHIQMTLPAILPGIGDILSNKLHFRKQLEKNMTDCLLHGVTHIRDALTDDLKGNRLLREKIESGKLPGPRIYQSVLVGPENGNFTSQRSSFVRTVFSLRNTPTLDFDNPDSGIVAFPAYAGLKEIRRAVDCAIERGAQFIKLYEQKQDWFTGNFKARFMSQEQLNMLVDYAHSKGIMTTIHHVSLESFRRALAAGVWSLAHLPGDGILSENDIRVLLDSGCILEPTATVLYHLCWPVKGDELGNHENMRALTDYRNKTYESVSNPFWMEPLQKRLIKGFGRINNGNFRLNFALDASPLFRVYARSIIACVENLKMLRQAAVPFGCGNDAGAVCAAEGMVGHELELISLFLGFGSEPDSAFGIDALKTATLNSARALGINRDFGSIDVNKVADLVVIDGDPLRDPAIIGKKADMVFMDGKPVVCDGQLVRVPSTSLF